MEFPEVVCVSTRYRRADSVAVGRVSIRLVRDRDGNLIEIVLGTNQRKVKDMATAARRSIEAEEAFMDMVSKYAE